ncbi:Aminoacid dehydrogenase-like protein [Serendipita vermifera]|nr:Aminoacid dehydrogenase-like protein [Serendipita vermifera]
MSSYSKENTVKIALQGAALLNNPRWNKGTAFTEEERRLFKLRGRLPCRVNTLDQQMDRVYQQLQTHKTPIGKNVFLDSLRAQNWILYYAVLQRHLKELLPVVYTPTEAEAISNFSRFFRRSEGLYLSLPNAETMEEDFLEQIKGRSVDLVVCSDAEAILGIGDQGVGGIGISTAKAVIYTLVGGIDPAHSLPVTLDVGTNNENLLNDDLYIGWKNKRIRGEEYDQFVDKFVQLVRKHLPHCLLHFEDFGVTNAQRLLDIYRDKLSVFNDDVQGTGAVTLAAVMSAVGITKSKLCDQTYVVYGAGSAGLGIARQIRDAMVIIDGMDKEEATKRFYLIDKDGLVTQNVVEKCNHAGWTEFQRSNEESQTGSALLDVVRASKATVLIGTSTHAGAFTEEVVKEMSKNNEHPIIMPLSNPSRLVEVEPKDAIKWSEGKALIATGSPFDACDLPNGKKAVIAECNNALIYPGIGLGSIISQTKKVSDGMLIAATRRLAELSPALKSHQGESGSRGDVSDSEGNLPPLLPDFGEAPEVNFEVALAVAKTAMDEGLANVDFGPEELRERAEAIRWTPAYPAYEYDPEGNS